MKELRELRMFVVMNEEEEYEIIEEKESIEKGLAVLKVKQDNKTCVELSINFVVGLNDSGTMKIRGKLQGMKVIIMIDCGVPHNFISEKIVKSLQIPTKETAHHGVILRSGTAIQGKGVCENVEIQLKNWNLKFCNNGKQISIKGDPSLTKARISLKSMFKTWGDQYEGFIIECRIVEVTNNGKVELNSTEATFTELDPIHIVLKQYEDIFEWPKKLPPRREIKHHIYFKESTDPINVRPYTYGYHQKEEMEKLVEEMLASEVMRPSKSPFTNLVLLVQRKNGSWCFCVDYRAVNNATVLDKFSIPVVEELLDELNGTTLFSKFNLKYDYH
ncbi:hypothetical protein IC575_020039 [Cucumis melo]